MVCDQLSKLLGFACHSLDDSGGVAMLETGFAFSDGDPMPIFVETIGETVRFFDDGEVLRHFMGRGVSFEDLRRTKSIRSAAEPFGVVLNARGEVEVLATVGGAPAAFAAYVGALCAIGSWEREHTGVNTDHALFVDEVAMYLRAWKPEVPLLEAPEYVGISGQVHRVDFGFDGKAIVATGAHHAAVSSSIKKLLDIRSAPGNSGVALLVVLDDRGDADAARREALVLQTVADVLPFSALEAHASAGPLAH